METQKNSYSDLYLMLSPIYDTLHLRRCNLGDKGFEEFALENVQRAHDQALFPNNWMFHYHFSEEQIPRNPWMECTAEIFSKNSALHC